MPHTTLQVGYALTRLETLILVKNQLRWVPPAVIHLPLVRLDLSGNGLVVLCMYVGVGVQE
jgi:hypothetical protein